MFRLGDAVCAAAATNESIPVGVFGLERKQTIVINVQMHHQAHLALENILLSRSIVGSALRFFFFVSSDVVLFNLSGSM